MSRSEFSRSVKDAAWKRCKGRCEGCTAKLFPGKFDYDHTKADGLGGEPTLENCQVLCTNCHYEKTHHQDRPIMAKADRQRKAQNIPKTLSKWGCGRGSKFKKKMNGQTVPRGAN